MLLIQRLGDTSNTPRTHTHTHNFFPEQQNNANIHSARRFTCNTTE
uniref:Uncharacterized protein n=1 Tax=Tetraselmis sp. GSL018 TaxID=582737 RepID=A0A061QWJ4_9CHLO